MAVLDLLAESPLLTIFLVVAVGTAFGAIPFGPLRFGSAGALFVGLALGAADPRLGEGLALVQTLGLALFVYTVGLAAGSTFFRDLRRQLPLMAVTVLTIIVGGGAAVVVGKVFNLGGALTAGTFAGGLTSTPALAAATAATGSTEPAVGYAIGYPLGTTVAILAVSMIVNKVWPSHRDPLPAASLGLDACTAQVNVRTKLVDVPGFADQSVLMSYLSREGRTRVVTPGEELQPGDQVVLVGPKERVSEAVDHIGERVSEHLADDRSSVENRRFVISNKSIAGLAVGELDIPGRFGGVITRVRRGDLDLLARDSLTLELGDRVLAVVPREELNAVSRFLGDSERRVSEIDALTVGIGMVIGLAVGLITIPLPGGASFVIGTAAGPLVVGMILGGLERTGKIVWGMPAAANLTIRQLGLLFFLAAVGLSSGKEFAAQALTMTGLKVAISAILIVTVSAITLLVLAKRIGVSAPRASGALAGMLGQPAILAYAGTRVVDERIEAGYAAIFALGIIVKILLVQLLVVI